MPLKKDRKFSSMKTECAHNRLVDYSELVSKPFSEKLVFYKLTSLKKDWTDFWNDRSEVVTKEERSI